MRVAEPHGRHLIALVAGHYYIGVGLGRRLHGDIHRLPARRAHVDGDQVIVGDLELDGASRGFHLDLVLVGEPPVADKARKAARAVAALVHLGAIGIEYPVAEIRALAGRLHQQQLVKADAEMPVGQPAQLRQR